MEASLVDEWLDMELPYRHLLAGVSILLHLDHLLQNGIFRDEQIRSKFLEQGLVRDENKRERR